MPGASGVFTPPQPNKRSTPRRRHLFEAALIVLLLAALLLVGYFSYQAGKPDTSRVEIIHATTGTIAIINSDGTDGCVNGDDGTRLCSQLAIAGDKPIHVGDHVGVAREWITLHGGDRTDTLLIWSLTDTGK